jgi:predicted  nucleic acid-binding Zn-ribbon protein
VTTASPEDQRRLLEVQEFDTRLDQIAHRRAGVPALAELTKLESQVGDLHTALVASRTAANDLRRAVTKAEADVEQVRSRAARDQARLDSGTGSVKDLQALQSELVTLGRRQNDLEEVELEVMERLEAVGGTRTKRRRTPRI